ncbi:MAG: hypothetical protein ACKVS8_02090 [Phycisphaerales bacterium]
MPARLTRVARLWRFMMMRCQMGMWTAALGLVCAAAGASGQIVLSSSGSIVHRSNLGTTPAVRSTGPYADCRVEYNGDGVLNPDDLGDFITEYFTEPAIAGPGGYATSCPEEPPPYDAGYRCNYTTDGSGQCSPPFPDNLGDYITDYFADCSPVPVISPLPNYTSAGSALPPLQLPLGALIAFAGGPNTTAKAGLGTLSTPGALGIVFATGTSLTQAKNLDADKDTASTLEISFEASWQLTSALGPTAQAGASLTLLGSLPPSPVPMGGCPPGGRFSQMDLTAEFLYAIPGGASGLLRPTIESSPFGPRVTDCGPYSMTATDNAVTTPTSFPAGTVITITGVLTLALHNDLDEAFIDNVTPVFVLTMPLICRADYDRNGVVNLLDSMQFQNAFNNQTPGPGNYAVPCPSLPAPFNQGYRADFDRNCVLNAADQMGFQQAFNTPCPPPTCRADFNHDQVVDSADVAGFNNAYFGMTLGPGGFAGRCATADPGFQADFNGDCVLDQADRDGFFEAFYNGNPPGGCAS